MPVIFSSWLAVALSACAMQGASNRLIDVEDLSERELSVLRQHFRRLVEMSRQDEDLGRSHSVEEAEVRHASKQSRRKG